jgi:AbrB family looped-hinge helix DNA binding protein
MTFAGALTNLSDEAVSLTKKGQITIPARFRKSLNLREGSKLLISQTEGVLTMRLLVSLEELGGSLEGKMTLVEANAELDKMRVQDRY